MLGLLARSATGQALSVYTNIITGPRRPGDVDGPGRGPRRRARQRPVPHPRQRVPGGAALHPLRRLPQRLPGLPPGRRPRVRLGLRRADRRRPHAAARTRTTRRPGSWPRRRRCAARAGRPARSASRCTTCCSQLRQRDAGTGRRAASGALGFSGVVMALEHPGRVRGLRGSRPGGPRRGPRPRRAAARLGRQRGPRAGSSRDDQGGLPRPAADRGGPGAPPPHRPLAAVDRPPEVAPAWPDAAGADDRPLGAGLRGLGRPRPPHDGGAASAPPIAEVVAGRGPVLVDERVRHSTRQPGLPDDGQVLVWPGCGLERGGHRGQRGGRGHRRHRRHRQRSWSTATATAGWSASCPASPSSCCPRPTSWPATGDVLRHQRRALAGRTADQRRARHRAVPLGRHRDAPRGRGPRAGRGPRHPGRPMSALFADPFHQDFANIAVGAISVGAADAGEIAAVRRADHAGRRRVLLRGLGRGGGCGGRRGRQPRARRGAGRPGYSCGGRTCTQRPRTG